MTSFQIRLRRRGISKSEILDDLKRVAIELNSASITRESYDQRGQFGATTVLRNFGKWNIALKEAGLEIVNRQDISNEELFENIANLWISLGRQPFGREMSDKDLGSLFSTGTYEKRFGSWNGALIQFSNFVQGGSIKANGERAPYASQKRTSPKISWRLRARILIRDYCTCQICGDSPQKNMQTVLHVDHIKPWSLGGETVEENLRALCAKCNIGRSNVVL
jgi:hypothetical protein